MADNNAEVNSFNEQLDSLGGQLRRAREEKKSTVEKVASDLSVKKDVIVNLEAENWQALYGRTYARGHFINYVKYLGLSLDVLIAAFNLTYRDDGSNRVINETEIDVKRNRKKAVKAFLMALSAVIISIASYSFTAGDEIAATASIEEAEQNRTLTQEQSS